MNKELQQKLFNKYPEIFKINNPSQIPFDSWGIECWDGWYDLIDKTSKDIKKVLDDNEEGFYFYTLQLKQKFSTIRWYYQCSESLREIFDKIIASAEEESLSICEKCGTKDNVSQDKYGYILTLCDECRNKK